MQPEALTKFSQLVQEINQLLKVEDRADIDDFTFRRLERDAKTLIDANPAESFSLLGMLACLDENIDEMHRCHLLSIKYQNEDVFYNNYSISLENLFFFDEAYEYALKAYSLVSGREVNLTRLIDLAFLLEKAEDLQDHLAAYQKLTGKEFPAKNLTNYQFPEDDPEVLKQMLDGFNDMINHHPEMLAKPDEKLNALVDDLVDGVEID